MPEVAVYCVTETDMHDPLVQIYCMSAKIHDGPHVYDLPVCRVTCESPNRDRESRRRLYALVIEAAFRLGRESR